MWLANVDGFTPRLRRFVNSPQLLDLFLVFIRHVQPALFAHLGGTGPKSFAGSHGGASTMYRAYPVDTLETVSFFK